MTRELRADQQKRLQHTCSARFAAPAEVSVVLNIVRLKLQQPLKHIDRGGILVHVVPDDHENNYGSKRGVALTESTLN
jgi:hypothetical protein